MSIIFILIDEEFQEKVLENLKRLKELIITKSAMQAQDDELANGYFRSAKALGTIKYK